MYAHNPQHPLLQDTKKLGAFLRAHKVSVLTVSYYGKRNTKSIVLEGCTLTDGSQPAFLQGVYPLDGKRTVEAFVVAHAEQFLDTFVPGWCAKTGTRGYLDFLLHEGVFSLDVSVSFHADEEDPPSETHNVVLA